MSFRPVALARSTADAAGGGARGSLFGPAIGAPKQGLWAEMAVSPPRTPPSVPLSAPSPPPFALEETALLSADQALPGEAVVEGVCTMHDCHGLDALALVRFAQELNASTVLTGTSAPRVRNFDYVLAKPVLADAVVWKPMTAPTGSRGHVFALQCEGRPTSRIEAVVGASGALERLAVVDASFSPLAAAAGMADASAMLAYETPAQHLHELRALGQRMRTDARLGYVPTLEVCVGPALERLELSACAGGADATALVHARAAWATTRRFLGEMSGLAAANAQRHASTELGQAGAGAAAAVLGRGWSVLA